jgi:hypothetical protein
MNKEELIKIDMENLKRLKSRLRKDISISDDEELNESNTDYLSLLNDVIDEKTESEDEELSSDDDMTEDPINEDGDGGGVAMANAGNVGGMGNVSSAQPSSTPGAVMTGDGTTGSGDYGFPLGVYTKKGATGNKYIKMGSKKGKKKSPKVLADVANFLKTHKADGSGKKYGNVPESNGKVMNYQDFMKGKTAKVTKVKE